MNEQELTDMAKLLKMVEGLSLRFALVENKLNSLEKAQATLQELSDGEIKRVSAEAEAAQRSAREGMAALSAHVEKLASQKPKDPKTVALMEEQLRREAAISAKRKKELFFEAMKRQPLGDVFNPTNADVRLEANGFRLWLRPGWNRRIPQAFIETFETFLEDSKFATEAANQIKIDHNKPNPIPHYLELQKWNPSQQGN